MAYVADFDPTGFVQADPSTWPTPAGYSPGQWWFLTAPGTVNGVDVDVGDRMYPIGTGRLFGENDYGDGVYGGPVPAAPWPADAARVRWSARAWSSAPAWNRPPGPYDGAPFGNTGWRIAVEALLPVPGARLFGDLDYGDGVYGDTVAVATDWVDVACNVSGAVIRRGGNDGSPLVDVDELNLDVLDVDVDVIAVVTRPRRGDVFTPLRVSLIDPMGDPHPLFTGRIEQIRDAVDRPPRTVTIDAFGMTADLVRDGDAARPEETADRRVDALIARTGYAWGSIPAPPGNLLRRYETGDGPVDLRDAIDTAALSARWQTHSRATGVVEFIDWPTVANGDPITVTDRKGTQAFAATSVDLVADTTELLNEVTARSAAVQGASEIVATSTDRASVARYGRRASAIGFPVSGLSTLRDDLDTFVDVVRDRYGSIVSRVASIRVDTRTDTRWLDVLADLDVGQAFTVAPTSTGASINALCAGVELSIMPGRIAATIHMTTVTPTE